MTPVRLEPARNNLLKKADRLSLIRLLFGQITSNFCMLGHFSCLCCRLLFFLYQNYFFQKILSGTLSECQNSLDPDQIAMVVGCQQKFPLARKELNKTNGKGVGII